MIITTEAKISILAASIILLLISWGNDAKAQTYNSSTNAKLACETIAGQCGGGGPVTGACAHVNATPNFWRTYEWTSNNNPDYKICRAANPNPAIYIQTGQYQVSYTIGCATGYTADTTGLCVEDEPEPGCEYAGQAYNSLTETCECPDGQSPGWAGTVGGGLTKQCVTDFPDEPEPCPVPIGYVNGQPYCPASDPEVCPAGHNEGYVNGELVCLPAPEPADCPAGTTYEYRNGITQCWDDTPPTDPTDPTDPPDPGTPQHPDSPASNQQVQEVKEAINAAKDEAVKTNSKLDTANNRLTSINNNIDKLVNTASTMPANTEAATIESVNTGYWDQLQAVPLVQAFTAIANIVPAQGGSCSALEIDLTGTFIGTNINSSAHCDLAEYIRPILQSILMVLFVIFGFRHVVSA